MLGLVVERFGLFSFLLLLRIPNRVAVLLLFLNVHLAGVVLGLLFFIRGDVINAGKVRIFALHRNGVVAHGSLACNFEGVVAVTQGDLVGIRVASSFDRARVNNHRLLVQNPIEFVDHKAVLPVFVQQRTRHSSQPDVFARRQGHSHHVGLFHHLRRLPLGRCNEWEWRLLLGRIAKYLPFSVPVYARCLVRLFTRCSVRDFFQKEGFFFHFK